MRGDEHAADVELLDERAASRVSNMHGDVRLVYDAARAPARLRETQRGYSRAVGSDGAPDGCE